MTTSCYPFDTTPVLEQQWMAMARAWLASGVLKGRLNELAVSAPGTTPSVTVATGQAWVEGVFFQTDAAVTLTPSAAHPSLPRIDRAVLRIDWLANTGVLAVLPGSPAVAPTPPVPTQNFGTLWEFPLAQIRVDAGVTVIAASKVLDERVFTRIPAVPNLLVNGGLERWQRGNGPFTTAGTLGPDMWVVRPFGATTLSVSRDNTHADTTSQYCAACTVGSWDTRSYLWQQVEDVAQYGSGAAFAVRLRTATPAAVAIGLYDNSGLAYISPYHPGDGTYQTLRVAGVPSTASVLRAAIIFDANCVAYVDNAMLALGLVPVDFTPLGAADDLARCLRYYQGWGGQASTEAIANGQATGTTTAQAIVPCVPKAIPPTITFSAAADFQFTDGAGTGHAATGAGSTAIGLAAFVVTLTGMTGLTAGAAGGLYTVNSNARLKAEANP